MTQFDLFKELSVLGKYNYELARVFFSSFEKNHPQQFFVLRQSDLVHLSLSVSVMNHTGYHI